MRHRRPGQSRWGGAGFTLIELMIVVCIIAVSAGLILNRMLYYQEQAEKAAMENTLGTLRTALHLQFASLLAKNRVSELSRLVDQNPMEWLAEKPTNYIGEYFAPNQQDLTLGNWYFDLEKRTLIYLVKSKSLIFNQEESGGFRQFKVKLVEKEQVEERQSSFGIEGVTLDEVVP